MPPSRPLLLLLDWDSTLTTTSTIPLILSIPFSPSIHPSPPPHLPSHPSPSPLLHDLTASYTSSLTTHERTYHPPASARRILTQELAWLESLRVVEEGSIRRVEDSRIFVGVTASDVDRVARDAVEGGKVRLRRGWTTLLKSVQERNGKAAIISVGWSRGFILAALGAAARREGMRAEGDGDAGDVGMVVKVEDVEIKANEIRFDGSGCLDRYFGSESGGTGIWTAGDKVAVMDEMVGAFSGGEEEPWTVYVGDSPTDLGCLVRADVGICIRDGEGEGGVGGEQAALRSVLERVGVGCVHIGEFKGWKKEGKGQGREESEREVGKQLWWARDFDEVCESGILDGV